MENHKGNESQSSDSRSGFTLMELLIYAVIFSVSSVFLINILSSVTQTEIRETARNNVSQQVSFVSDTIQRMVRQSSLIENSPGVASSSLALRMSSSSIDKTLIYVDASSTAVYVKQTNSSGISTVFPLTDSNVVVSNFSITKFDTQGGSSIVQVDLTLSTNTTSEKGRTSRSWRGAISRISAATFDTSLMPNSGGTLDLGASGYAWKNGYFSNNVSVTGNLGVGGIDPSAIGASANIKSPKDIAVSNSSYGLVLTASNGSCFRIGVSTAGNITTSTVTCP